MSRKCDICGKDMTTELTPCKAVPIGGFRDGREMKVTVEYDAGIGTWCTLDICADCRNDITRSILELKERKRKMCDSISRREAIDAVCMEWCNVKHQDCKHPYDDETGEYYCDGCETALRILVDLPCVPPEKQKNAQREPIE